MKKHVVTGPIWCLSQCHPTITNSYSYSWIWNQMFLLIHLEIQELWVIITTNTRTQPENLQEILQISRISRKKNNSSRFPGFPGVLDILLLSFHPYSITAFWPSPNYHHLHWLVVVTVLFSMNQMLQNTTLHYHPQRQHGNAFSRVCLYVCNAPTVKALT